MGNSYNNERSKLNSFSKRSGLNGRAVVLRALPAGVKLYHEIEARAGELIGGALAGASARETGSGVEVFRRFLGDSGEDVAPITAGYQVVKVDSNDERALVRGLIARTLVREGLEHHIPERFVSASSECLELRTDESAVAALELDLASGTILSCGWDESVSPWGLASFIGEALLRYPEMRRPFRRSCESFEPVMAYLALGK